MRVDLPRIVIDTNVWISAALSPSGSPARLIHLALSHALPVFSPETFHELEIRIWEPEFDRYLSIETRRSLLYDLDAVSLWVEIPAGLADMQFCRDPDDDHCIRAALAAHARYLVSGDQDLLSIVPPLGLAILSPVDALTEM